jgi:LPXTG-site transpeptidase (sortase) family protein
VKAGSRAANPEPGPLFVPAAALTIVAALLFTFVATVAVIGPVRHARDQQTAFATFRGELANATAMVTQLADNGEPQPLGRPMAVLDIPQIGVREVVFEGTSAGVLRSGPGHRRDTPLPGQAGTSIILGRRAAFGGPFAHLDQLGAKMVFSVTTGQGKSLYRVIGLRRAGDPQPDAVAAGKGRLILITATGRPYVPEGQLRVDAELVSTVQPAGQRPVSASALPAQELALHGDSSVWLPILILSQALLIAALAIAWLRSRWGRQQVWLSGMPVLLALGVALADQVANLLPNLL